MDFIAKKNKNLEIKGNVITKFRNEYSKIRNRSQISKFYQVGIFYYGKLLTNVNYKKLEMAKELEVVTGFLSAIQCFIKEVFGRNINCLECEDIVFVFSRGYIRPYGYKEDQHIVGYAIVDKSHNINKLTVSKTTKNLEYILSIFRKLYDGHSLDDVSKFEDFQYIIKKVFS